MKLLEIFDNIDPEKIKSWRARDYYYDRREDYLDNKDAKALAKNYPSSIQKIIELVQSEYSNAWGQYTASSKAPRIYRGYDNSYKYSHLIYKELNGDFRRKPRGKYAWTSYLPDYLSSWSGYPSRIKGCQIGGTNISEIKDIVGHEDFYWLLPHNSVKSIGILPNADWNISPIAKSHTRLWITIPRDSYEGFLKIIGTCIFKQDPWDIHVTLKHSDNPSNDFKEGIKEFDNLIKNKNTDDDAIIEAIIKTLEGAGVSSYYEDNVYDLATNLRRFGSLEKYIQYAFSPKANNIELLSTSNLSSLPDSVEVWFNGPALAINIRAISTILRILKKKDK